MTKLTVKTRRDELENYLKKDENRYGVDYSELVKKFAIEWGLRIKTVKLDILELITLGKAKKEGSKIYHKLYQMPSERKS